MSYMWTRNLISYLRKRKLIKKLSKEYVMPKSYIRHMLAIEEGTIKSDVKDAQ